MTTGRSASDGPARWAPALGRLLLGLAVIVALATTWAPAASNAGATAPENGSRAAALLDTFFVTPGVTATSETALVQGETYELVVRGSWVEHVDYGHGNTATYNRDAVYCYGHAPEDAPSGAHCAETAPGPYCCESFYVGLGGGVYRFWTLAGSSGTPFPYSSDHVYRTSFVAPASGRLSVTSPYMSTWDTTGKLKVELFGEATGCAARPVAAAAAICGPQKVSFSYVIDGYPSDASHGQLDDDLVDVQARTAHTKLTRDSESDQWQPHGVVHMTTAYLSLHSGLIEKEIAFRLRGNAGYQKSNGVRRVLVVAKVIRSQDRHCKEDTRVDLDFLIKDGKRFLSMTNKGPKECLAGEVVWRQRKFRRGAIGVPVATSVS